MSVDTIHTQTAGAPSHAANPNSLVADPATGILYLRKGDSTWTPVGGATPAGADTQVQYNNSGAFAGNPDFVFDKTTVWTFGGSSDTVNIKFGSDAAATVANGQHFLDFGNTLGQDPASGTDGQVIRFRGVGALTNSTVYYGMDTGNRLFLKTNVNHRWIFTTNLATYDWGGTSFSMTTRSASTGVLTVNFSTGTFTFTNQAANQRTLQINANNTDTVNSANSLLITGKKDGTEDLWEYRCTGTNAKLLFKSAGSIDLLPVGIRASTGDFGVRIAPDQTLILTLAGRFGLLDIQNQDFGTTAFWRPNSGTGTGYAISAGAAAPLVIRSDLAAGSSFYAYGANLNQTTGSAPVGFWQYLDNNVIVSSMSLAGDIVAGNYTGIVDQNLDVTAGASSGAGAGRTITLAGTDGVTAGDGGDVVLLPGSLAGAGANGRVDFALAANVVGAPGAGAITAMDMQEFVRVKVNGVDRTMAAYLNV